MCLLIFQVVSSSLNGDLEKEKNIPLRYNRSKPLYGDLVLKLKEEIFFEESEEDADSIFGPFYHMAINSKDDMVILTGAERIILVNKKGKYVKDIGKRGLGPGEYNSIYRAFINSRDDIYLADTTHHKIHVFDINGRFRKHFNFLPKISYNQTSFYISSREELFALKTYYDHSRKEGSTFLEKRDKDGKPVKKIFGFKAQKFYFSGRIMIRIGHEYLEDTFITPVMDKEICFANNLAYKLYFCDLEGNITRIIKVEGKPKEITSEELAYFKKKEKKDFKEMIFPPHRPFFRGLLSDEKGRIYVIRTKPILEKEEGRTIDILNRKGRFLYRTRLPCYPWLIKNGIIYYITQSADDRSQIKKLIIQNYSEIKY